MLFLERLSAMADDHTLRGRRFGYCALKGSKHVPMVKAQVENYLRSVAPALRCFRVGSVFTLQVFSNS